MCVEWDNVCHMSLDLIKEQFPLGTGGVCGCCLENLSLSERVSLNHTRTLRESVQPFQCVYSYPKNVT